MLNAMLLFVLAQAKPEVDALLSLVKSIGQGHAQLGVLGAVAAGLVGMIRVLKLPLVQKTLGSLSPKLAWDAWPKGAKIGFVFMLSTLGAVITGLAGGASFGVGMVVSGLVAGMAAIAMNETTEAVGVVAEPVMEKMPAAVRKPVGLVFPGPRSLAELRVIEAEAAKRKE